MIFETGCLTIDKYSLFDQFIKMAMIAYIKKSFRLIAFLSIVSVVTGCYLPGSFDAEIELSRTGHYKMSFDGYIVEITLYDGLRKKKLTQKQIKDKIKQVIGDFKRDRGTKEVSYYNQGAFKVRWVKTGDVIKSKMITFFRRNENMLSITYDKKKAIITLRGKYIKKQDRDRLIQMGLDVQGVIKIKTDAKVLSHNATKVTKDGLITIYGWKLNSIEDPSPRMVVTLGLL